MTVLRKLAIPAAVAVLLFMANIPPEPSRHLLGIQLIGDAKAIFGVRRRTRRRSLFFGYEAGRAAAEAQQSDSSQKSTSSEQNSTSQQSGTSQKTTEPKHAATATQPHSAKTGKPLPLGTVVPSLPSGCSPTTSGDIEYYHCGSDYYRAVFQGNNLVYVTAKP
jgi:hypothetical protein